MFKIGLHETGLCEYCGVIEDNMHFIIDCVKQTEERKEIKKNINSEINEQNYQKLMSNPIDEDIITKFISENNIEI